MTSQAQMVCLMYSHFANGASVDVVDGIEYQDFTVASATTVTMLKHLLAHRLVISLHLSYDLPIDALFPVDHLLAAA